MDWVFLCCKLNYSLILSYFKDYAPKIWCHSSIWAWAESWNNHSWCWRFNTESKRNEDIIYIQESEEKPLQLQYVSWGDLPVKITVCHQDVSLFFEQAALAFWVVSAVLVSITEWLRVRHAVWLELVAFVWLPTFLYTGRCLTCSRAKQLIWNLAFHWHLNCQNNVTE